MNLSNTVVKYLILVAFVCFAFTCTAQQKAPFKAEKLGPKSDFTKIEYKGKRYFVFECDPKKYKIELFNVLPNKTLCTMAKIRDLKKDKLVFAMNGGMLTDNSIALGLFVHSGKQTRFPVRDSTGYGNFYMQPNGVFMMDYGGKARVLTTVEFMFQQSGVTEATQSGPMLVSNGHCNPKFVDTSHNINIRNAIGVDDKDIVYFVISTDLVNFYNMAYLYIDELFCNNALYLDGVVSQYLVPELGIHYNKEAKIGPIISVSIK